MLYLLTFLSATALVSAGSGAGLSSDTWGKAVSRKSLRVSQTEVSPDPTHLF